MYKQAGAHQAAYELAINYLAPEAVLREDLDFLEDLFTKLDESLIPEFSVGGQVTYSIPSGTATAGSAGATLLPNNLWIRADVGSYIPYKCEVKDMFSLQIGGA